MICSKRCLFSVFFVLFGSLFISLLLNVNNTFAVGNTFEYTWTNSNDSISVSPLDGHVPDNTFCGYKYFYVSAPSNIDAFNFNFSFSNTSGITGTSRYQIPPSSSVRNITIYSSFNFDISLSLSNCTVAPFVRSDYYLLLSDEPIDVGLITPAPSGSLSISENGTYDVTNYAEAVVDVPDTVIQSDYHDDLVSINHSILICGAVLLVLYFFYAIYRMLIKSTGGK